MKSVFVGTLIVVGLLASAAGAFAAQYQYVAVTGLVETIFADNADQAMGKATDIALHSGVLLVDQPGEALPENVRTPL